MSTYPRSRDFANGIMSVYARLDAAPGAAQGLRGIGIRGLATALSVAIILFTIQMGLFLYLRSKPFLSHVYNPKSKVNLPKATQLPWTVIKLAVSDNDLISQGGLDAYYFVRYLRTLIIMFLPILFVVLPILIPLNYIDGRGHDVDPSSSESSVGATWQIMGLDTLAFGNVRSTNTNRYTAHLVCAVFVVVWICCVSLYELRKHAKDDRRRNSSISLELQAQDYLLESSRCNPLANDLMQLDCLLNQRDKALTKFESAATTLIRYDSSSSLRSRKKRRSKAEIHLEKLKNSERCIKSKRKDIQGRQPRSSCVTECPEVCECCSVLDSSWRNIIWSNIDLHQWERRLRATIVVTALIVIIAFWAVPVSWTAALSQVDSLIRTEALQSFFQSHTTLKTLVVSVAGVLPGVALALMLIVLPPVLRFLSFLSGATLKSQQAAFIQRFYFVFLFVQMFLIVSLAAFFTSSLQNFLHNLQALRSAETILNLLSQNLPTAANYFFSFMILQALSGSANVIMQRTPMFWFIADRIFNYTPRQKWSRGERMDIVAWGAMFPLYTTLACISLVYSVIAPLISLFAIISFGMLCLAHSYSVVFLRISESDHGGILYPRAINQTFTGVYIMELCLIGLFLGVKDTVGKQSCFPHAIMMSIVVILTAIFQVVLNSKFIRGARAKTEGREQEAITNFNAVISDHLMVLTEPKPVWVPTSDWEVKYGRPNVNTELNTEVKTQINTEVNSGLDAEPDTESDTELIIDCHYFSKSPSQWWKAFVDENRHVQIENCLLD